MMKWGKGLLVIKLLVIRGFSAAVNYRWSVTGGQLGD